MSAKDKKSEISANLKKSKMNFLKLEAILFLPTKYF